MPSEYPGVERRKANIELMNDILRRLDRIDDTAKYNGEKIDALATRVEHANNNAKQFKILLDEEVQNIRVALQGDETKNVTGLSPRVKEVIQQLQSLMKEFQSHVNQDQWFAGIMITLLVSNLTVLFKLLSKN